MDPPARPPRPAVQRKALPRPPPADEARGGFAAGPPPPYEYRQTERMEMTGLPPPPLKVNIDPFGVVDQKLGDLHLNDRKGSASYNKSPSYSYGPGLEQGPARMAPPQRTGTSSTTATSATWSTAPSSAFPSRATTFDTILTTPTISRTPTPVGYQQPKPPLPPLPAAGQYAPAPVNNQNVRPRTSASSAPRPAPAPAHPDGASKDDAAVPSFWKTAFDETRFFAGGLIHKPYESTKHYTILRHSPGLIMYRGPSTCVIVTLFSTPDHPIPADRTVWMQQRGFSGDTGLKLKSLVGARGSWLDVTPERRAAPKDLPAADERGYQRDIAKIMKKAKHGEKSLAKRVPRETLVVRIPNASVDGYFRLVVCTGGGTPAPGQATTKRKVLCGSPVFRIASTSTDSSIFRGASLRTLPLEAGVKIASFVGTNTVSTLAEPVVGAVQTQVERFQPGTATTLAATEAYGKSGIQSRLDAAGERFQATRENAYQAYGSEGPGPAEDDLPPEVIGADTGPEKPFPITFQGRVVAGTGRSTAQLGVPTANISASDVPDDIRMRFKGTYFGWATVIPSNKKGASEDSRIVSDWIEAVITVGHSPWANAATVVGRNEVAVHLFYDARGATFVDTKLKIILMGFLRAGSTMDAQTVEHDAPIVVTSLSRTHWGPQATMQRMQTERSARSIQDRYVDTRGNVQKKVDRIPLHWAGVRTSGADMRDQLYGNGGYWVPR